MPNASSKKQDMSNTHKAVTDYLASLKWDGTPRLDRWLVECAGADDVSYVHEVSRMMLVDAVRRARHPGCRVDRVPVIVGPQGSGKSSALRVLAVEEAWSVAFPIGGHPRGDCTAGKWFVELWDLEHSDPWQHKEYVSHTHDTYRSAYDLETSKVPRQFMLIGTADEGWLLDSPTVNRRFWPVKTKSFDLGRLSALRDQLWAEAAAIEASERPSVGVRRLTVMLDGDCHADDVAAIEQVIRRIRGVATVERLVVSGQDPSRASVPLSSRDWQSLSAATPVSTTPREIKEEPKVHAFERGHFRRGERGGMWPEETCEVCGRDPRSPIHSVTNCAVGTQPPGVYQTPPKVADPGEVAPVHTAIDRVFDAERKRK